MRSQSINRMPSPLKREVNKLIILLTFAGTFGKEEIGQLISGTNIYTLLVTQTLKKEKERDP